MAFVYRALPTTQPLFVVSCGSPLIRKLLCNNPARARTKVVCDDNDGGMNHRTTTNVLYGDGSVKPYEIELLREEGIVDQEEESLWVGPDSPIEDRDRFFHGREVALASHHHQDRLRHALCHSRSVSRR